MKKKYSHCFPSYPFIIGKPRTKAQAAEIVEALMKAGFIIDGSSSIRRKDDIIYEWMNGSGQLTHRADKTHDIGNINIYCTGYAGWHSHLQVVVTKFSANKFYKLYVEPMKGGDKK